MDQNPLYIYIVLNYTCMATSKSNSKPSPAKVQPKKAAKKAPQTTGKKK